MSYIDHNRPSTLNQRPTAAEQTAFNHQMDFLLKLPPPKRITVNIKGQTMLNEYFESKHITGPFRAVPIALVDDQFSPYMGHNV